MKLVRLQILAVAFLVSNVCIAQSKSTVDRGHTFVPNELRRMSFGYVQRQQFKLEGLFGRPAAGVADFQQYTAELKASGIVWTDETLDAYLRDPNKLVPGLRWPPGVASRTPMIGKL